MTSATSESKTGVYRPNSGFYLKSDNGNTWNPATDLALTWDNINGDLPLAGNWGGDGKSKTGVYRPGAGFFLKMDNTNTWTPATDLALIWDNIPGDLPVAGDWNKDGYTETGVYRPGVGFLLKMDKPSDNTAWNSATDLAITWDNIDIDLPIAGNFV